MDLNVFLSIVEYIGLALLFYLVLHYIRGTRGSSILVGIIVVLGLVTLGVQATGYFLVLQWILENLWNIGAIALIIIFQPELRRAFAQVGSGISRKSVIQEQTIQEIAIAVRQMSRTHTGALIVFERQIGIASIKNSAVPLDAKVNATLLLSLFYPNSPLHDGALIIHGDKIEAGHAILPLTMQPEYAYMHIGTRHRAAIGITEETDAVAIVVSEETGKISIASGGVLKRDISPAKFPEQLKKEFQNKRSILPSFQREESVHGVE